MGGMTHIEAVDLGFLGDDSVPSDDVLDHSLLHFRGRTIYLRLVSTIKRAMDYAAGGFHSSVARGLVGGSHDLASVTNGTVAGQVPVGLGRDDCKAAWEAAARRYLDAYKQGDAGKTLGEVKGVLAEANLLADAAYKLEGVDPPRDPVLQVAESTDHPQQRWFETTGVKVGAACVGLGILALLLFGGDDEQKSKRSKKRMTVERYYPPV
jgi:hypothetical protein